MAEVRILREGEVERLTGLSKSTRYNLVESGDFPSPVALSKKASGWLSDEIEQWIESRRGQNSWHNKTSEGV